MNPSIDHLEQARIVLATLVGFCCIPSVKDCSLMLDLVRPEDPKNTKARLLLHHPWELLENGRLLASSHTCASLLHDCDSLAQASQGWKQWCQKIRVPFLVKLSAISLGCQKPDLNLHLECGQTIKCPASVEGAPNYTVEHLPWIED